MSITGKILIGLNVLAGLYWVRLMWKNTPKKYKRKKRLAKSYFSRIEGARNFFGS